MTKIILLLLCFFDLTFGNSFRGKVLDALNNEAIPKVALIINSKDTIITDKDGEFEYQTDLDNIHVDIFKLRYREFHFDFDLQDDKYVVIPLHPLEFHTHEVLVNSEKHKDNHNEFFTYSEGVKEINSNINVSVGETLNSIKGVNLRSMGSAPTRPIFRGLGNDRLKINIDGIENKDLSASSPDHNIAIDPQSINEANLLRGPQTLKYSSSSSAGIINLENDEIPILKIDKQNVELKNYYHSNNKGKMSFAEYAANAFDLFNLKLKYSIINSENIKTPIETLQNSNINSENYSIGIGKIYNNYDFGLSYNYYENNYGIPPGPNGLHPNGVNIEMYKRDLKFKFNYHFHDNKYIEDFSLNYLYNYLQHNEFESSGFLGAKYIIDNNLLRLDFVGKEILNSQKSKFGMVLGYNYFDAGAAVRTPEVKDFSSSIYFIQTYQIKDFFIDIAYRNEIKSYYPTKDQSVSSSSEFDQKVFQINTLSNSIFYNISKNIQSGLIISYDERIPTLEELYSMGPHLASYSYDIGNQNIEKENSINIELIFQTMSEINQLTIQNNLNLYNYFFLNYITPRNTGEIDLLRTRLPIFENQNIKANLAGFEDELIISYKNFEIKNVIQYTHGINLDDNIALPMIPPLKNNLTLTYKFYDLDLSLSNETAAGQTRIDLFETETPAYSIFNFKSSLYFYLFGVQNQLVLNVRNIFDTTYRNHLSRIKDIMPESGLNISIGLNNYF